MADCGFYCICDWILLFLWYISIPVYVLTLYTILKYRQTQFSASFWTLTLSLGIADLARLIHVYLTEKLPLWGWLPWLANGGTITAWLARVPEHYVLHAEFIGVLLISVNRYTALTTPLTHELKWTRKFTTICLVVQWFLPVALVAPIIPLKHIWITYPNTSMIACWIVQDDIPTFMLYYFVCLCLANFIRVMIYGFLYGRMSLSIRSYNKTAPSTNPIIVRPNVGDRHQKEGINNNNKPNEQSDFKTQCKLMLVGFCLVLLDLCGLLHACQFQAYHIWWPDEMNEIWWIRWDVRAVVIGDVFGWINVWLLLIASKKLRGEMKKVITCSQ